MTIVAQNGYRGNIISCENGFEIISKLEPQGELKSNNYFIWIGNPSPRKNIEGIMESFRKFSQEYGNQQRLVLVAPLASHERLISLAKNIGIDESMILLSDISDTTRDALYRCATALIFPSYCEGFGYPILEAMTQGCPPISSRHGPSQEIVGDTFPLSESLEPKELAVLMRYAANITVIERQEVRLKLIERAKLFSMESMATRTLQAILDAAG
jgi:glycosyltransferase involved in cell wall biosynthesis